MNADLRKLEKLLYGYNYCVFLRTYAVDHPADADVSTIVRLALGQDIVLGNTYTDSRDELMTTVKSSLEYRGDEGHGPKLERLDTPKFQTLRDSVLNQIRDLQHSSVSVTGFWLKQGHPAYPVFWDYAYLFRGGESSTIFIGSSSD